MAFPIACSPMLHLLALRARSVLGVARGDAWAGTFLAMERAVGEGSERLPYRWMDRWPVPVRESFWQAAGKAWAQGVDLPLDQLRAAADTKKPTSPWGQWNGEAEVQFGVAPIPTPLAPPRSLKGVGVVPEITPDGFALSTLACLEAAKESGLAVWLDVPGNAAMWQQWGPALWHQNHRVGVATWLHPPEHDKWADYAEFLAQQAAVLVRQSGWEQWVWPVCDLLEYSLEDVLLYGKPIHRSGVPWKGDGRNKAAEWTKVRRRVWDSASAALGGAGALEEVLVATVLAKEQLLLR